MRYSSSGGIIVVVLTEGAIHKCRDPCLWVASSTHCALGNGLQSGFAARKILGTVHLHYKPTPLLAPLQEGMRETPSIPELSTNMLDVGQGRHEGNRRLFY